MSSTTTGSPLSDLVLFPSQLYESALTENQKLKTKLQEAQLELADIKSKLEKMAQVRGGRAERGRQGHSSGDKVGILGAGCEIDSKWHFLRANQMKVL